MALLNFNVCTNNFYIWKKKYYKLYTFVSYTHLQTKYSLTNIFFKRTKSFVKNYFYAPRSSNNIAIK